MSRHNKKQQGLSDILTAYEGYYGCKHKDSAELREYREYLFEVFARSPLVYVKYDKMPQALTQRPFADVDFGEDAFAEPLE